MLQELEVKVAAVESKQTEASQSLVNLTEQLEQCRGEVKSFEEACAAQQQEKADLAAQLAATERRAVAGEDLQELLNKREAELEAVRQQADGLAAKLATAQERFVRAQVAAEEADKGRAEACERADAALAQLQEASAERDEAVQVGAMGVTQDWLAHKSGRMVWGLVVHNR